MASQSRKKVFFFWLLEMEKKKSIHEAILLKNTFSFRYCYPVSPDVIAMASTTAETFANSCFTSEMKDVYVCRTMR